MPANLRTNSNRSVATSDKPPVLYVALELGWNSWKLAFAAGPGPAPRQREMPAQCRGGFYEGSLRVKGLMREEVLPSLLSERSGAGAGGVCAGSPCG
jgi:hypothetical protein